ncbi:TIGR03749 family integrating conjugative element protein [Paraburkholderia sp. Ac-20342]|uniref:TIGR03749 family integrating conjugative element protein n=1 Tax=Paraburkholderia sp. Ac-20342 TaxID=2703889 RepID=UPI00197D349B|nr:TIGR03749 family integrating conjugative element protein [Paraburkholderia sp. Ac-20342]MBN3848533.1 TIGR03749 family integrating conjugative element protein [Paraburkholderia sp. Ac-20342]
MRLLALLALSVPVAAQAVEILRWERMPLAIPLLVDQERVVFIDRNVRVGIPAELDGKLRVQSAGGAIYLRASDVIEPSRLQLQDADTGALILLDIEAKPAAKNQSTLEPVRIVEGDGAPKRYGTADRSARSEDGEASEAPSNPSKETPVPVVLTRYAAQNLFAPLRTVEAVSGIGRVNVRRDLSLRSLLPSLPVQARALAAWRLEDFWVTAVRLRNTTSNVLSLDPRVLQGDFVTATFQHPDLGPAGQASDTTVVYLVTRRHGLAESLLPVLSPFDASLNLTAPDAGDRHEK